MGSYPWGGIELSEVATGSAHVMLVSCGLTFSIGINDPDIRNAGADSEVRLVTDFLFARKERPLRDIGIRRATD